MAWRAQYRAFGFRSVVEDILDKPDFKIEDLVKEAREVIQEVRGKSTRLIAYLTTEESLRKLIGFIVCPSPIEGISAQASSILSTNLPPIQNAILDNPSLVELLFSAFFSQEPLSDVQIGYVCRVLSCYVELQSEKIFPVLIAKPKILPAFISKVGIDSVKSLVTLLVIPNEYVVQDLQLSEIFIFKWLISENVVLHLLQQLSPAKSPQASISHQENAAAILKDMIERQSRRLKSTMKTNPSLKDDLLLKDDLIMNDDKDKEGEEEGEAVMLEQLESEENLNFIFDILPQPNAPVQLLCSVLTTLFKMRTSTEFNNTLKLENVPKVLQLATKNFGVFIKFLDINPKPPTIGQTRIHIIDLIITLLTTNYYSVQQVVGKSGIFNICFDLFSSYSSNLLHNKVVELVQVVLQGSHNTTVNELPLLLIKQSNLIPVIVKITKQNFIEMNKPKGTRLTHMGNIIKISELILDVSQADIEISQYLANFPGWDDFVEAEFNLTSKMENSTREIATFNYDSILEADDGYGPLPLNIIPKEKLLKMKFPEIPDDLVDFQHISIETPKGFGNFKYGIEIPDNLKSSPSFY